MITDVGQHPLSVEAAEWRTTVTDADVGAIRRLIERTGFFSDAEAAIAAELAEERLARGAACGYHFILASIAGTLAGYTCYGPIAGTDHAFDLYWIAVAPERQGAGLGKRLIASTETAMQALGATRYFAETSSTSTYQPTRTFYLRSGFREVANIADFYRPGDGKVIYEKRL